MTPLRRVPAGPARSLANREIVDAGDGVAAEPGAKGKSDEREPGPKAKRCRHVDLLPLKVPVFAKGSTDIIFQGAGLESSRASRSSFTTSLALL